MAILIDGKTIGQRLREEAADAIRRAGTTPGFAAVLVGDDPASALYVSLKQRACAEAGIRFELARLPATATEAEVLGTIAALNARADVHAILVQVPLPPHLPTDRVIAAIAPAKDVDGFTMASVDRYLSGEDPSARPLLIGAIVECARAPGVTLEGKTAVIVGKSDVFTSPLEYALRQEGCKEVTRIASPTDPSDPLLGRTCRTAHLLVVALGKPGFITGSHVRAGAIVIDIGTNRLPDGKVVGDVDVASVEPVAGWMTPVPGGVGPVTVGMLMQRVAEMVAPNKT
jgi:methylenetetrahydrofolate dehydrogenase (NADP+)/methenyltetrahydrofolate cyclohydrolase